jgi:trimeric autotransporter adhesin
VNPTWKASAGGTVRDLVVNGNTAYFGGSFTKQNGQTQGGLGAVTVDTGKLVPAFNVSTDKDVFGLTIAAGRLVISGNFTHVNGAVRNSLASVTLATNALDGWAPARVCSICNQYWDVVVDNNTAFVGTSGNHLGAFNLTTGAAPFRAVAANGDVQALATSGGVLYAGGHFGTIGNQTHAILAALSETTGAVDATFNPRFVTHYPGIWALSATTSKLYAGGAFTAAGPTPPKRFPYFAMFSVI